MSTTKYNISTTGGLDTFKINHSFHGGGRSQEIEHGSYHIEGLRRFLNLEKSPDATIYTLIQTSASKDVDSLLRQGGLESRGYFSTGLLSAIHKRLSDIFGENYYSFPMVDMGHSLELEPFYPHTHVLRGFEGLEAKFRAAVGQLLTSESIDIMIQREAPQNYHTPPLELLKANALNSSPLVIDPRVNTFSGPQIIAIANQLMPYSVRRNAFHDHSD